MKTFQIIGLVLFILGLIGLISGTGSLLAQLLVLGLGILCLVYGYTAKK